MHNNLLSKILPHIYPIKDGFDHCKWCLKCSIDDDLWQGKPISAKTPVTIIGEIDIDYKPTKRVEVDVDQVQF